MADDGACVPEIRGERAQLHGIHETLALLEPALDDEREHAAAAGHLALCDLVLGMGRKERITHRGDARPPLQPPRRDQRVFRMFFHPNLERLHALGEHPRVERRQRRPGGAREVVDLLHQILSAHHHTAHHTALSIDVLGGGVEGEVCAELNRSLQDRCGEAVVHDQDDALLRSQLPEPFEIHQVHRRIRGRFHEDHARVLTDLAGPRIGVRGIDVRVCDPEPRQNLGEDGVGRSEERPACQDVIPTGKQCSKRGEHGSHAGGHGVPRLGALQAADFLRKLLDVRIGEPGIDVPVDLAGERRTHLFAVLEDEARGQEHRHRVFVVRRFLGLGSHGPRLGSPVLHA